MCIFVVVVLEISKCSKSRENKKWKKISKIDKLCAIEGAAVATSDNNGLHQISLNFRRRNDCVRCHCSISLFRLLRCPIRCCWNCCPAIGRPMLMVTMRYLQLAVQATYSGLWLEDLTILIRDKRAPYPNKLNASPHFDPIESPWCQSFGNASLGAVHSMIIW